MEASMIFDSLNWPLVQKQSRPLRIKVMSYHVQPTIEMSFSTRWNPRQAETQQGSGLETGCQPSVFQKTTKPLLCCC